MPRARMSRGAREKEIETETETERREKCEQRARIESRDGLPLIFFPSHLLK